jgi:hypothetical protein
MLAFNDIRSLLADVEEECEQKIAKAEAQVQSQKRRIAILQTEVAGANNFLETHDFADGSEVLSTVATLNDLVFEFASNWAFNEVWQPKNHPKDVTSDNYGHWESIMTESQLLTPEIIKALVTSDPSSGFNSVVLQWAMQSCLNSALSKLLTEFCFGTHPSVASTMDIMAGKVQEKGNAFLQSYS